MPPANKPREPFGPDYYERFYESKRTRVQGPKEVAKLVKGVLALARWLDVDIESVVDIGAGPGLWRDWFRKHRPEVAYRSTDVSAYACKAYGHERRDIATWRAKRPYDLVVCQGVLPYLSERDTEQAIENLAAMTGGLLYLEAPTTRDLQTVCDNSLTDEALQPRSGSWYRERLERHYDQVGMGVWAHRRLALPLYELEMGTQRPEQ